MRQLGLAPSEFWRIAPDHFWWLVETLAPPTKQHGLTKGEREDLIDLLERAERGEI